MPLLSKLMRLASSPQGRQAVDRAVKYAKSPEGRAKVTQARERLAASRRRPPGNPPR
jgi:hypothetical protein